MNAPKPLYQITSALLMLVLVYFLVLWIIGRPKIVTSLIDQKRVKPRESTIVLKGYAPSDRIANMQFNTSNVFDQDNFRKIARSVNTKGGAQFTYSFWIKLQSTDDQLYKNRILLLKGDDRRFKTATYNVSNNRLISQYPEDYVVACPLIGFGENYRHLKIMINTTSHPQTRIDVRMNTASNAGLSRRNVLSLLPLKWHLLTFVFEDGVSPYTGHENGIRVQTWLDDFLIQETSANDNVLLRNAALRQNDGNLIILPEAPASPLLQMGDVKYYNYALKSSEISTAFREGPPTKPMEIIPSAGEQAPPYLSAFNKIDVYNR